MYITVAGGVSVRLEDSDRVTVLDGKCPEISFHEKGGGDSVWIRLSPEQLLTLGTAIERAMREAETRELVASYRDQAATVTEE